MSARNLDASEGSFRFEIEQVVAGEDSATWTPKAFESGALGPLK
jgi:hypothetical protein